MPKTTNKNKNDLSEVAVNNLDPVINCNLKELKEVLEIENDLGSSRNLLVLNRMFRVILTLVLSFFQSFHIVPLFSSKALRLPATAQYF